MTIVVDIFPRMWELITIPMAFLCYHIIYNTKTNKVDFLAYDRDCVAHNDILYKHLVTES